MIPLLARLGAWLQANPLWGLIAGLLAALGAAKLRQRHLETRAAEAQATADRARMKLHREAARVEAARVEALLAEEAKAEKAARDADSVAAGKAKAEGKGLKDIAKRWPFLFIIAAGLMVPSLLLAQEAPAPSPAASVPRGTIEPCEADADLSGLVAALNGAAAKATPDTLDRLMLEDAALALEGRARERAALCARVDALGRLVASLEASLGLRARLVDMARADVELYQREWEASLKRTVPAPRSCLWGHVLAGVGGFAAGVAAERE